jgi:uncharacterized protein YecE (DUF72 family)
MPGSEIHVGTSGWIYSDWVGTFYPRGLKPADRLAHYAAQFDALEVNVSFYRLPNESMIAAWNSQLPDGFHLVVKGPRRITHLKRLRDCEEELKVFLDRVLALRTLRVILWQLPPSMKKDIACLQRFLAMLPACVGHAMEFRDGSWWDGEIQQVLRNFGAAFVAASMLDLPADILPTGDLIYVRFHGLGSQRYKYDYTEHELARWTADLRPYVGERTLYAFFNNGYDANAPRNALTFRDLLKTAGSG